MNKPEYHDIVVDGNGDQWSITTTPDGFYTTRRGAEWFDHLQGFGDVYGVIDYIERQTGCQIHRYCVIQTTDGSAGWLSDPKAPAYRDHPIIAPQNESIPSHPQPDEEECPF